jgi:hypothetical protein
VRSAGSPGRQGSAQQARLTAIQGSCAFPDAVDPCAAIPWSPDDPDVPWSPDEPDVPWSPDESDEDSADVVVAVVVVVNVLVPGSVEADAVVTVSVVDESAEEGSAVSAPAPVSVAVVVVVAVEFDVVGRLAAVGSFVTPEPALGADDGAVVLAEPSPGLEAAGGGIAAGTVGPLTTAGVVTGERDGLSGATGPATPVGGVPTDGVAPAPACDPGLLAAVRGLDVPDSGGGIGDRSAPCGAGRAARNETWGRGDGRSALRVTPPTPTATATTVATLATVATDTEEVSAPTPASASAPSVDTTAAGAAEPAAAETAPPAASAPPATAVVAEPVALAAAPAPVSDPTLPAPVTPAAPAATLP